MVGSTGVTKEEDLQGCRGSDSFCSDEWEYITVFPCLSLTFCVLINIFLKHFSKKLFFFLFIVFWVFLADVLWRASQLLYDFFDPSCVSFDPLLPCDPQFQTLKIGQLQVLAGTN